MKSVNNLCEAIINEGEADDSPNKHNNTVHRWFCPSSRYLVDFADNFSVEDWMQYDTSQDAEYFGVWVNKQSLRILTYAEGDWILVCCLDAKSFNSEVREMHEYYEEGTVAVSIDQQGNRTVYRPDRRVYEIGVCAKCLEPHYPTCPVTHGRAATTTIFRKGEAQS